MSECLVLGPEGSGKTLLLRKLKEHSGKTQSKEYEAGIVGEETLEHTMPTVGVNLEHLALSNGNTCTAREIGGQMAPLWENAYAKCTMIIYVVDSSNRAQVSASTVLFLDLLSSDKTREKPILLFFNKIDLPLGLGLQEYKSVMRLEDILTHATQNIVVISGSGWTGEGIDDVLKWISNHL